MREILIYIISWLIPLGFISLLVLNAITVSIKMRKQQKEKNHEEQKKENPSID